MKKEKKEKKKKKKSDVHMNLFLENSTFSLIFLIFIEFFFFLLDGINVIGVIKNIELITKAIWCSFFVLQLGSLNLIERFSKKSQKKQLSCVYYLFIIFAILLPLSSALLFTSSLSWGKLIYFTQILGLYTSIEIRRLLLICVITFFSGFLRFYHALPNTSTITFFSLLLMVQLLIPIIVHMLVYTLAKQISYIKEKPLTVLDRIEPYFYELEKRAILIRNQLIFRGKNSISVDILGNHLFENEINEGIKKIKTFNKNSSQSTEYRKKLTISQHESSFDVSDVSLSSINTFSIYVEKVFQDSDTSNKVLRQNKTNKKISKNLVSFNDQNLKKSLTNPGENSNKSHIDIQQVEYKKQDVKNKQIKGENSNILDNSMINKSESCLNKTNQINDKEEHSRLLYLKSSKNLSSFYNPIIYGNFKNFNNRKSNREFIDLNNKNRRERYKKDIVKKNFSLLFMGHEKFHRKCNILLSEKLKHKINYVYFDKNNIMKRSKIIPIYVLERHNLNNISMFLHDNSAAKMEHYYKSNMLMNKDSPLTHNNDINNISKLSSLKSTNYYSKNQSVYKKSESIKYKYENHKCLKRKCFIQKYSCREDGSNLDSNLSSKQLHDMNSMLITRDRKVSEFNINSNSYLFEEFNKKGYKEMTQKTNNARVFYLTNSHKINKNQNEALEYGKNNNHNYSHLADQFQYKNNISNDLLRNNSKFHFNKSENRLNKLDSNDLRYSDLSSNEMFYVEDALDDSMDENDKKQGYLSASSYDTLSSVDRVHEESEDAIEKIMKVNITEKSTSHVEKVNQSCSKSGRKKHIRCCFRCKNSKNSCTNNFPNASEKRCLKSKVGKMDSASKNKYYYAFFDDMHNKKMSEENTENNFKEKKEHHEIYEINSEEFKNNEKQFGNEKLKLNEVFKKKCTFCLTPKISLKKQSDMNTLSNINFSEFYDFIPLNYKNKPYSSQSWKILYFLKKFLVSIYSIKNTLGIVKSLCKNLDKKGSYWKNYNDVMYTSQWKDNIDDNELDCILKYKNFMKWYNYWVTNILLNYYKSTYILIFILCIFNVILIGLQMIIIYFFLKNINTKIYNDIILYSRKFLTYIFNKNNLTHTQSLIYFAFMRIPTQIILNMLFLLPSMIIKNYKNIKILHIFAILNCLVNITFGIIDISYSLNSKIFELNGLYNIIRYYNIFDMFLIGKLTTSIFLIPFITNFNGNITNFLIYFAFFCYIGTFYYYFIPSEIYTKLIYITNYVILLATTISMIYYSKLIAKSRKFLFVKYVLPYFIYLTFLNTGSSIQSEITDKTK